MYHVCTVFELTEVQPRKDYAQVAGWAEACAGRYPKVFGTGYAFGGPTYFQGATLTAALCNALDSETAVHPAEWP